MTELDLEQATLVTRSDAEQIRCAAGVVRVVPAWQFLLSVAG